MIVKFRFGQAGDDNAAIRVNGRLATTNPAHLGVGDFPTCFGFPSTWTARRSGWSTPDGVDSGLCVGAAATASQEEAVTLQECGASAKTVRIADLYDAAFTFFNGYAPAIHGQTRTSPGRSC